jgi:hypothetical protein
VAEAVTMRGKSTLALTVILIAVVAYIYFVDSKKPVDDAAVKEKAFSGVTADDIEELQIKSDTGDTSRLQKADGKWQLVEPVKADADNTEVSNIASSLASIDIQRVVDENASNMKEYGLDPPRIEVAFRSKGKKDMERVLLGEKTPTGGDMYARLPGKNRVFLVNSFLDSTFNKNTFALRDKKVLAIERDKVDSLEVVSADKTLQFAKRGSDWRIVKPVDARGDFGTIEGAIERVVSLQMQGITAEAGGDPKQYGLDKPSATINIGLGSSKATLTLGKTENAVVYAKDASRPMIFTVAPTLTTDLLKDVTEYRRKDLFDSRSFTMDRVTFMRGSETITLERAKGKDGKDVWKNGAGKEIDSAKVDDLLAKVGSLRADKFQAQADPALKSPTLTVNAAFDGKMETVTLARSGTTVVASRADEPGSATVDAMAFDEVIKALDAVK